MLTESTLVVDETLQKFREDILSYQRESYSRLDVAFFSFYNRTFELMTRLITKPYNLLKEKFPASCKKFPWSNLEPFATRRLINICDEVPRFLRKVFPFPDNFIEKVYPNPQTLSSQTLFELMTEEYFANMDKHLEFVVPIYHENPGCATPLFASFVSIYKQPVDSMIMLLSGKILNKFLKLVGRNLRVADEGARRLLSIADQINHCSKEDTIDTYGCVSSFVGFNCWKRRTKCGPVYMTMARTLIFLRRIDKFHVHYDRLIGEILDVVKTTDGQLLEWSNELDKCLNTTNS